MGAHRTQFSYAYETYHNTHQKTVEAVDNALYKVAGKHINQLSNAELVGYGLAAGTIIVAGSAAAAWIGLTAMSAAATVAPLTLQTSTGSLGIQVAANEATAQAAADDGSGNLKSKTAPDGYTTEHSYSALDLVTAINYNDAKEVS